MKTQTRVVVIGGGVVGVSTLYNLARQGCSDCVLIERRELTSGSTWHAAGLLPLFNVSYSVGQIHKMSVNLYRQLEDEEGDNLGFARVSNIRLAQTSDRWDEYMYYAGVAETIGVRVEKLTPNDVAEIWPFCNMEGVLGAIRHPDDGYIQPADLTQSMARRAREKGAQIYRNTVVNAIEPLGDPSDSRDGCWRVITDKGEIICDHIVSATGNFARKTGAMVGLDLPVIPVEHQYIVTEPHPEIKARHGDNLPEMGVLRDSDSSWYMREENGGLLLGIYESGAPCCYVDGPSPDSEFELFQEEAERLAPQIESAMARVPIFGDLGVKKIYNGAIAYTPDGSPIIGPAWGLKNFWLNEGHSFGVTAAGGAGHQLAEWILKGEPSIDMMGVDPRRYGPYAGEAYLKAKNEEAYASVFAIHYPDEERPAARPLKQSPCYSRLAELGAVFGQVYGWERANWFAPENYSLSESDLAKSDVILNVNHAAPLADGRIVEKFSFRRSNYFEHVGRECRHVHEKVGLLDMTAFSKFRVKGPDAERYLSRILANPVPGKIGALKLCHLLTVNGGVRSEFTVYRESEQSFYLVSAGAFERHDFDNLQRHVTHEDRVQLECITPTRGVFVLAGPHARALLQSLTDTDLSNAALPWLRGKALSIGPVSLLALRVNFVGEMGYELHHPIEMQNTLFDILWKAGASFALRPFGIRAMDSLRLEKSYRLIPRELSIEYSAFESGLERFVRLNREEFIGRDALVARQHEPHWKFVTAWVQNISEADARGSEPIYKDGRLIGRATSGGYGFRVDKSLALAMIKPEHAVIGNDITIKILDQEHDAVIIEESPFDPENLVLRG